MSQKQRDGMNYAPVGEARAVVRPGEFQVAAMHLDHGHIRGMCNGLVEAGASLKWVYDPRPERAAAFAAAYPGVAIARSEAEVFDDPDIRLVAAAAVTNERAPLGIRAMQAGKDYFTDKAPLTTLEQLAAVEATVAATGRRYWCYFSERLHVEAAILAGYLIDEGRIGRVLQVTGFGPHTLNAPSRPDWFFRREQYGGILCDIGSHQVEQFLYYAGTDDAEVVSAHIANHNHPEYPELEDFGEAVLRAANGATQYFRVDWFSPGGLDTWGDGRTFILGTDGYIELRKYTDVARGRGNQLFIVDHNGMEQIDAYGKTGYPFFGELILDSLNRTETAMTQAHVFAAARLCVEAQNAAVRLPSNPA